MIFTEKLTRDPLDIPRAFRDRELEMLNCDFKLRARVDDSVCEIGTT